MFRFRSRTTGPLEKIRKSRSIKADGTMGRDMCDGCYCYDCNPIHSFADTPFRRKVNKRLRAGVCPSCGRKPCTCKSNIRKNDFS